MQIHKEGWLYCFIATSVFVLLLAFLWIWFPAPVWLAAPLSLLSFLLWFWVFWFFRIPSRRFLYDDTLILSPCDGKVVVIEETEEPEYFKDRRLQISIFMSPLNVHVNRYPVSGKVQYYRYHPGKYLVAWHPKSSTENERSTIVVKRGGTELLIRQIAGAVARRIITYSREGQEIKQHEELGFIRFGSRVDLFLPIGTKVLVEIGDKVQNGIHAIAEFPA